MRRYQQFTYRDRVVMETMLKVGKTVAEISDTVGYTKSTIYREMKRGAVPTMKTGKHMVSSYLFLVQREPSGKRKVGIEDRKA